jgi:excisionase family DNA binding protein
MSKLLSIPEAAEYLGLSPGTLRNWLSLRRLPYVKVGRLIRLQLWLSQSQFAAELGVHVRTLRDAVRSGRRDVTYGNRVVFGHPVPRAAMAAGRAFVERCYKQSYSRFAPKARPPEETHVPPDYVRQLLQVGRHLRLTQTELANRSGLPATPSSISGNLASESLRRYFGNVFNG